MHVLAISGSLRPDSSNTALLRALVALAPKGVQVSLYDGLGTLPFFDPGLVLDPDDYRAPGSVLGLRDLLTSADALIFCTPEYAFGMPGVLKNALDWMVTMAVLEGKPVSAIAASPSHQGGEKAHQGLLWVLSALGTHLVEGASFTIPKVRTKVDAQGHLHDEATARTLAGALTALISAVEARRRPST